MDFFSKFKEKFQQKDRKKIIESTVIIIIIGIIAVLAGDVILSKKGGGTQQGSPSVPETPQGQVTQYVSYSDRKDEEKKIEEKLRDIISKIQGVGEAEVMIVFKTSAENVLAYNTGENESTTTERDKDGGTRSIVQKDNTSSIVFEENQDGGSSPVIVKEIKPVVDGVLVVAEGAGDPVIQERIFNAVQALFDIPLNRIRVVEMEG